jgi:hypothetical protein
MIQALTSQISNEIDGGNLVDILISIKDSSDLVMYWLVQISLITK